MSSRLTRSHEKDKVDYEVVRITMTRDAISEVLKNSLTGVTVSPHGEHGSLEDI